MNWLLISNSVGSTTVATAATPSASEPDCPSPSSQAFSAGANKDQTDSARSSPSATSSSSAADAFSFSTSGQRSRSASTSTSVLCFGAGGAGVRLWSSSKALVHASSKNHGEEEDAQAAAANVAPKGFAVGRHLLRRISRRLRKARAANKETPAAPRSGAVDDTARERAEAVARAIAHCKETLRRGTPRRRRRQLTPPLSSLSLDLWLRDRQDEIIASGAECGDALARHAPCMRLPLSHVAPPVAAAPAVATGTPPCQISGVASSRETETRGGFSELEFLESFDGDDELIDRHFITVQI